MEDPEAVEAVVVVEKVEEVGEEVVAVPVVGNLTTAGPTDRSDA